MFVYVYVTQNTYFRSALFFPPLPGQCWPKGHSGTYNKCSLVLSDQDLQIHMPLDKICLLFSWCCFKHQKFLNWLQGHIVLSKFHSLPPWKFYDRIWNESLLLPATEYKINRQHPLSLWTSYNLRRWEWVVEKINMPISHGRFILCTFHEADERANNSVSYIWLIFSHAS
jgi:hypothetical protein